MSSTISSLLDESPTTTPGESPNPDNAVIPGEEPTDDGEHGESQGIAELLAESDDSNPDGESHETPGNRLIDLAETLEKKPEDLYGLTVAMADGESKTIGELKDVAQKAVDLDASELDLETRRQEQEAKFTRMHGELRELVAALPEAARKSEAMQQAAQRYNAKLIELRKATDEAIPEWKDSEVRKTEREAIEGFLGDYGFDAGYLDNVLDGRTMRFIRDAWKLHKRVSEVMAKVRKAKPGKRPGNAGPTKPAAPKSPTSQTVTPVNKRYAELLDS